MYKLLFLTRSALFILFITFYSSSFASKNKSGIRSIDIAGLIFNTQTLMPIEAAKIFDAENNFLGVTDKNGYYKVRINYTKNGPLNFKLKIDKQGYQTFLQHENWADIQGDTQSIMYFGLKESQSSAVPFSTLDVAKTNDLSYTHVVAGFNRVKTHKQFDDKLTIAKAGNENVLFEVDGKLYIVNNTGWIQISSDSDPVSLDGQRVVLANQLNKIVKRRDIKGMTPVDSKVVKFAIYTKNVPKELNHQE